MRIRSLEIAGFKSFVDRTRFAFRPGITAIVGPNGCGKSNVVDAIRWAMGEQSPRRLRGKGMEDVIFAGAEDRASVGLAEVVLAFDNSEGNAPAAFAAYEEIQVARRLYRDGESEYLINKVPSFARALAHGADVLVLDEATSSIDTETEAAVQRGIHILMEGKTALVIAHRLSTIEDVDRIYVLHHGRIVEAGSHAELLAADGLYARLHRLQQAGERGEGGRGEAPPPVAALGGAGASGGG